MLTNNERKTIKLILKECAKSYCENLILEAASKDSEAESKPAAKKEVNHGRAKQPAAKKAPAKTASKPKSEPVKPEPKEEPKKPAAKKAPAKTTSKAAPAAKKAPAKATSKPAPAAKKSEPVKTSSPPKSEPKTEPKPKSNYSYTSPDFSGASDLPPYKAGNLGIDVGDDDGSELELGDLQDVPSFDDDFELGQEHRLSKSFKKLKSEITSLKSALRSDAEKAPQNRPFFLTVEKELDSFLAFMESVDEHVQDLNQMGTTRFKSDPDIDNTQPMSAVSFDDETEIGDEDIIDQRPSKIDGIPSGWARGMQAIDPNTFSNKTKKTEVPNIAGANRTTVGEPTPTRHKSGFYEPIKAKPSQEGPAPKSKGRWPGKLSMADRIKSFFKEEVEKDDYEEILSEINSLIEDIG